MFPSAINELAHKVISAYAAEKFKIVTAESCTGGLIAGALTEVPGSSAVIDRGFITYSNDAKVEVLGVDNLALAQFGAVSPEVAAQMARGALEFSHADIAVSVTGIAGPDGGSEDKPVGLVYFGFATRQGTVMHYKCNFSGNREKIRFAAVEEGLKLLIMLADQTAPD
ncbi:MAG: CinA family protein [Alphaproteobacteria bacterium]